MWKYIFILFIFFGIKGQAQFGSQQIISDEANGTQMIFASDLDNDGKIDVLSANQFGSSLTWYKNIDGSGNFGQENLIASLNQPISVYASDLDGDGDNDVLGISGPDNLVVWYENLDGQGNFSTQKIIDSNADRAFSVIATDIDGDGDMDVISVSDLDDTIAWYENTDGHGNFDVKKIISTTANNGRAIYASDIDGDGDQDIVATSSGSEILTWFENLDGLGNFGSPHIINPSGLATSSAFVVDIDGDNDMDIVTASPADDEIAWYENLDGLGDFGPKRSISIFADFALSTFAVDLDNDGDIDVLSASSIDNKIAWYENLDGLGDFGSQQIITTDAISAKSVFAADIDNDGAMDVLSASQNDNKIAWYRNLILGVEGNQMNAVKIYPNPSKRIVNIDSKNEILKKVSIFDVTGKRILQLDENLDQINISNFQKGIYFLRIVTDNGDFIQKIIKE